MKANPAGALPMALIEPHSIRLEKAYGARLQRSQPTAIVCRQAWVSLCILQSSLLRGSYYVDP